MNELTREYIRLTQQALAYHSRLTDGLIIAFQCLADSEIALSDSWKVRRQAQMLLHGECSDVAPSLRAGKSGWIENALRDAKRYRQYATEIRARAEEFAIGNRERLLAIADDYERLAQTLDELDRRITQPKPASNAEPANLRLRSD